MHQILNTDYRFGLDMWQNYNRNKNACEKAFLN